MRIYLTLILFLTFSISFSQVGIGTTEPDDSAILEVESDSQGMLTPRMTTSQRNAISNPAEGLLVYDTDESSFYFYENGSWSKLISENSVSDHTGWAEYKDGTYTSASPLVLSASTKVTLPNDASTVRDNQKPDDVTTFYDSTNSTITGRNGDGVNIVIEFKARPNSASTTRLTVAIDIGGAVGEIYVRDFVLAKGNGVEHYYLSSFDAFTLDTWEANGGAVKIVSTASADIYDIRYVITRTHKAK